MYEGGKCKNYIQKAEALQNDNDDMQRKRYCITILQRHLFFRASKSDPIVSYLLLPGGSECTQLSKGNKKV